MEQRRYTGVRGPSGCKVVVGQAGGSVRSNLPLRLDLMRRSPTGFEWGYSGSGPAQLALAIMADHLEHFPEDIELAKRAVPRYGAEDGPDEFAIRIHQRFKVACVAQLPKGSWTLTSDGVREVLRDLGRQRAGAK